MNTYSYAQLILTKLPKIYDGVKADPSTNISVKTGYLPAEN
jgi:hypothetical protein